jgi:hypothetical protein
MEQGKSERNREAVLVAAAILVRAGEKLDQEAPR